MYYSKDHGTEEEMGIKRYEVSGVGLINLETEVGHKVETSRNPTNQIYFASLVNGGGF